MAEKKRIGLREVRALGAGEIIWDGAVTGFHARAATWTHDYLRRVLSHEGRSATLAQDRQAWCAMDTGKSPRRGDPHPWKVADGTDPAADKRLARDAKTVAELAICTSPTRKPAGC